MLSMEKNNGGKKVNTFSFFELTQNKINLPSFQYETSPVSCDLYLSDGNQ
jgi:hypothetical protein